MINHLPPTPANRSGWPWEQPALKGPDHKSQSWPRVTIITSKCQLADFISRQIRATA